MSWDARRVLPTKINLIRLKREFATIKRIRKVLEEKRDVLLMYIRTTIPLYEEAFREALTRVQEAYRAYLLALSKLGYEEAERVCNITPSTLAIELTTRILFSVKVPGLQVPEKVAVLPPLPFYNAAELLLARKKLLEALPYLLKAVEMEVALRRLINELKETQRLMNAIDYALIPFYDRSIRFIKLILEERMREEFTRLKHLKKRLERERTSISKK